MEKNMKNDVYIHTHTHTHITKFLRWQQNIQWNSSVQFSSVSLSVSNSLRHHEPLHARPPCPSPTPRIHPNPCPLSRWDHPTISSSVACFSSCPQSFPASGVFFNESPLCIRWPKYWSFSISPSKEYSGYISFRIDWFDLPAVQGTLKFFSNSTVQKHQFFGTQLSL